MRCIAIGPRETPVHSNIALRGVRLVARLSGMSQRTTVEQTYVNFEPEAIEAVYTFPLPESAAVCGFEVITGERVLTGAVDEIEAATATYDDAIGDGHGAFLAEQNRPDVFTVCLGNLKPRQAVTIRLTYVCPLERVDKAVRVAFPTTVAPRYVTATATDPLDAMIDGVALNPPHVLSVPYGLTMQVDIDLGRPVRRITSPSHGINVKAGDDGRAAVSLAGGMTEMDRDVVLAIELEKEHEPFVQAAPGGQGESYLAVSFVPEFEVDELLDPEPSETVFVLDCSGSMQGQSMQQAVAALELCLRSLSVGDTFNVCRFGSTFDLLRSEPLHYSEETLNAALSYVRDAPDLGGTELYAALHAVMTPSPRVGRRRQVIVLTDGQVSNEPALLELARDLRMRNRLFSFGIGSACSASLVKGLARATGGAAEFITGNERIDDKVLRTFGRLTSPFVEDVAIDWGGCEVQTLAELPPVFDGDVMTVFGRATGRLPRHVTLACRAPSGPKQWAVPVPVPTDDGGVIATMWARRAIQSLEEVNHLSQGNYRRGKQQREAEQVIRLSKEFNLLSSLTAFVAVEHRTPQDRNDGRPALRRIPVTLAQGWGDISALTAGAVAFAAPAPAAGAQSARRRSMKAAFGTFGRGGGAAFKALNRSVDSSMISMDKASAPPPAAGGSFAGEDPADLPVIKLTESMLEDGVRQGSSDIHLETLKDRMQVRFRVDGQLSERDRIPLRMSGAVVRRLKVMSGLDPAEKALPQQGRFKLDVDGAPIEFDVSVVPSTHGPSVVLHVRDFEATHKAATLRGVLALQSAEGWFGWDRTRGVSDPVDAQLRRIGLQADALFRLARQRLPPAAGQSWDPDRVARTLVVLALLHHHFNDQNAVWRRAAQKGLRYVQQALGVTLPEAKALLDDLRAKLATVSPQP